MTDAGDIREALLYMRKQLDTLGLPGGPPPALAALDRLEAENKHLRERSRSTREVLEEQVGRIAIENAGLREALREIAAIQYSGYGSINATRFGDALGIARSALAEKP